MCVCVCTHVCMGVQGMELAIVSIKMACCYLVRKFELGYEKISKQNFLA